MVLKEGYVRYNVIIKSFILITGLGIAVSSATGCATKEIDYKASDKLQKNQEFEKMVTIKEIDPPPPVEEAPATDTKTETVVDEKAIADKKAKEEKAAKDKKKAEEKAKAEKLKAEAAAKKAKAEPKKNMKREPEIEDSENFTGRLPNVSPFRLGESVVLNLSYFNITAGTMELKVGPDAEVNGKKAHTYSIILKSNSMFSRFYAVDDKATTHVDAETLVPFDHQISVKESKQVREIKSFFDNKKLKASFWESKITKEKGEENKKYSWNILPFSQNVVSAIFYLRNFTLTPGKTIKFRVAEEKKNIVCTVDVLRKEKIKTELGYLNTIVVQPKIEVDGVFKPVGDILFWLTDDDRKMLVRIESEIKIGTIVGKIKSMK